MSLLYSALACVSTSQEMGSNETWRRGNNKYNTRSRNLWNQTCKGQNKEQQIWRNAAPMNTSQTWQAVCLCESSRAYLFTDALEQAANVLQKAVLGQVLQV
eukprot:1159099-Pelagomonas_calceolata.AAC.3